MLQKVEETPKWELGGRKNITITDRPYIAVKLPMNYLISNKITLSC
jgi:hypothetical protein